MVTTSTCARDCYAPSCLATRSSGPPLTPPRGRRWGRESNARAARLIREQRPEDQRVGLLLQRPLRRLTPATPASRFREARLERGRGAESRRVQQHRRPATRQPRDLPFPRPCPGIGFVWTYGLLRLYRLHLSTQGPLRPTGKPVRSAVQQNPCTVDGNCQSMQCGWWYDKCCSGWNCAR